MQCRNICEMLSPYIDGMLESSQVVQVEEHIAGCASCRLEYEKLRAAVEMVRGLPEVLPPAEFHDNLLQKLQSLPTPSVVGSQTSLIYRLAWGKWSKTLAVAAILFLSVGITTLWYDKHDGWLPGAEQQNVSSQSVADRGELGDDKAVIDARAQETVREQHVQKVKPNELTSSSKKTAQEPRQEILSTPSVPAPEKQLALRGAGNAPTSAVDDGNPDADAAGEELVAGNYAEPEGQSTSGGDSFFTMMAAPREDLQDAAGQVIENNSVQAKGFSPDSDYTATLMVNPQSNVKADWSATAGRYGGFVESGPQQTGGYWVLRIPIGNVDGFLAELINFGQAEIQSNTRDVAVDLQQAEEQLNLLLEQEKTLVAQQRTGQAVSEKAVESELAALRQQITLQQRAVADLQMNSIFAKINLYIK
ncbi:hypothetical protein SPSYN_02783 [Sporotomaculum syntrophicum]|uniref:Anti-sigma-W factor RsiW n=1 Tax=Sporotomaculum syntrophicum TaxID=182264 RepID=A0A9D3AVH6_9FIRM|nr:zf-HC2 domain-containing protein [Sporotomaculum syntrophicum]KAF1084130.1 hypothetical protein SPSYN_02783 [Sporotomaculum syntrophicum]